MEPELTVASSGKRAKIMGNSRRMKRPRRRIRERYAVYRENRADRVRKPIPRHVMPSAFTLSNLFCGFLSIIEASQGHITEAAWLIIFGGLFDLFDGMVARLTNGDSIFGVELDSLADIVTFGIAPSFLVYQFGLSSLGTIGIFIAALPVLCGAVRLARYNVHSDGVKKDYFDGMPIPSAAASIIAFILVFEGSSLFDGFELKELSVLIPIVIMLSFFMISTIRFESSPVPTAAYFKKHPWKMSFSIISILLMLFLHEIGLFIFLAGYISYAIGRAIFDGIRSVWNETGFPTADSDC